MSALLDVRNVTRRDFLWGSSALTAAWVLAGCSSDRASAQDGRVVEDYFGPITIPDSPERVIAGDDATLGSMLALGVKPVGAAVNVNSLPHHLGSQMQGIANITAADGFDIEKALALDPDLFITYVGSEDDPWNENNYRRAQAAMATYGYMYNYVYLEHIHTNLNEVAKPLRKETEARALIAELDARIAALRERVVAAGLTDKPVSVVRLSMDGDYSIRVGTSESIALRALGIAQPDGQRNPEDFRIDLSPENLTLLNSADTLFVYVDDNAKGERDAVESSPLWPTLNAVRSGNVHFVSSGVWNSADIVGLGLILDDIERYHVTPAES
ncbi:ABC transporter substrate-binding protein [Hoyosella sp. YIM 151337]|uniref:ABC transporter substrate-binding protein n=1 Tax=Hoyosella sp. YIM 151337 TaxID=2992742 RepID=UPI0022360F77|nr:ABC transporter substrate-binding protein [Hoyosella sp. YIM 151337]MCW4354258.1 ABC transporter substrate-binding protein [Hoyosella sp. YIM 151337]